MSESQATIFGAAGRTLSREEKTFFRGERPWGFILFARNISEPEQIRDLVAEMRDCVDNDAAPVLIDQEGGRVQRLRPPLAEDYPPAAALGTLYKRDREAGLRAAWLMSRLHAFDLARYGINADCLPVLDVPVEGAHDVIGDRAYAHDPETVVEMGRAAAEGLLVGGVLPVIKHIPGHGRARSDSHKELPRVEATFDELAAWDFEPFRALANMPMAMTAHVVYEAIDPSFPATISAKIIEEIIRSRIGFDGLLMSDDLSMRALSGDFATRTRASLAAGCDVVLHCDGDMYEMREVAKAAPALEGDARRRAEAALSRIVAPGDEVEAALREEFGEHMAALA